MFNIKNQVGIKGSFSGRVIKPNKPNVIIPKQPNIILDQGLDFIATRSDWARYCHIGTDGTAPTVGDQQLTGYVNRVPSTTTLFVDKTLSSPYKITLRQVFFFDKGEATGSIKEIGLGGDLREGLTTRALTKDELGNPRPYVVTDDDSLEITYDLEFSFLSSDINWSILEDAVTYSGVIRSANVDQILPSITIPNSITKVEVFSGAIGDITYQPTGERATPSTFVLEPYVAGQHKRVATISFSANVANFATGIASILWRDNLCEYQASVSPAIDKTSKKLDLQLETSWGRTP